MIGRSNSFLGVAVSDRAIVCAEVTASASARGAVRRTATFSFPTEVSLDAPAALGQALAAFLRQKRFTASRVVVGVPARWLMAVEKELPPSSEENMRAALRLQAERLAVAENGDVVFDYAGRPDTSSRTKVLLVGVLRRRLDSVLAAMDAAGMSVVAVTSTGLTLANSTGGSGDADVAMLLLGRSGGEVVWKHGRTPRLLRHVTVALNGHGAATASAIGSDVRRAVAMVPPNGHVPGTRELLLLDGVGLSSEQVNEISDRLGWSVQSSDGLEALGIDAAAGEDSEPPGHYAPAISLALAGALPDRLPLDFSHTRLAPARARRISRRTAWSVALGLTAVIGIASLFWSIAERQSQLHDLEARLEQLKPDVAAAQSVVDRVSYSRGYFENRPAMLDCLRQLSLAFRNDERIWATSFSIRENGKGQLTGKAADQRTILAVLDRLNRSPSIQEAKLQDMREADARSRDVSFSVSFTFNPVE